MILQVNQLSESFVKYVARKGLFARMNEKMVYVWFFDLVGLMNFRVSFIFSIMIYIFTISAFWKIKNNAQKPNAYDIAFVCDCNCWLG